MAASNKSKTSNVAICLKAIKDFVDMDEAKVTKEEQIQIKARAKKAVEHLPSLYVLGEMNNSVDGCPSITLPTI